MASHRASGRPGLAQRYRQDYPADEWILLTRLPRAVLVAASAAAGTAGIAGTSPDPGAVTAASARRGTVAEGLAGLEALAAGRSSDSDLVRAVVATIYAESEERSVVGPPRAAAPARVADPGAGGGHRPVGEPRPVGQARPVAGPVGVAGVLGDCRRAAAVLAARADPADSAAYRLWVEHVAARVCAERGSGLLIDLGVALGLR